jgi:allophanate hydrolase subunit 1
MGDRALLVELGDEISPSVNRKVRELFITLERHSIDGLVEAVPSYRSLLIVYNPQKMILPGWHDIMGLHMKRPSYAIWEISIRFI